MCNTLSGAEFITVESRRGSCHGDAEAGPAGARPGRSGGRLRGRERRITEVGEEVLHRPCRPVTESEFGTPGLRALVEDMFRTLRIAEGAGLAANQVGVDLRLFVYDCRDDEGVRHVGHVANPVPDPLPLGRRRLLEEAEGCLSVPGPYAVLARPDVAVVRGQDLNGNPLLIEGTGYFARCLLHETDHLDGGIYLDRLGKRERREVLRRMAEQREAVMARRAVRAAELEATAPGPGPEAV
jgi:peptide deformylase